MIPEFEEGNLLDGWDRIENTLKGAKYSIEPGLVKQISNGNQRVISEKISVSADAMLISKELFDRYRATVLRNSTMNLTGDIDLMFYDVNNPGMITILRRISLNFKGMIESGDGYQINLSCEVEKPVGSCLMLSGVVNYGILSGVVTDMLTGLPIVTEEDIYCELDGPTQTMYDVSDSDGIYLFRIPVPNGESAEVTLLVACNGYVTVGPVTITVLANQEVNQDIQLTPA
jgi:hypothetical protein